MTDVTRAGRLALPVAIALLSAAAFAPALGNGWVWDDEPNFLTNPHFRGLGWTNLRWMLSADLMSQWIPVAWFTLGLDYILWGMNPAGFHLTNLALHGAGAAVLYAVARRLLVRARPGDDGLALTAGAVVAALFFAVHPLRAESVVWITERRDVLSGLLALLTVLAYVVAVDARRPRRGWLALSLACYALALLAKATTMALPVVLALIDLYPLRRLPTRWRGWASPAAFGVLAEKLPYAALAAVVAVRVWSVVADRQLVSLDPAERIILSLHSLWFYAWKTLVPVGLSPLYELPPQVRLADPPFLAGVVGALTVTIACALGRRRWPAVLVAWLAYAVLVAPVSGLIHRGPQLAADRYSYLPSLAGAMLLGGAASALVSAARTGAVRRPYASLGLAGLAGWLAALALMSWSQALVWRDADSLWTHAVTVDPGCARCYGNLAASLGSQGLIEPAIEHYRQGLALRPDDVGGQRTNLGLLLFRAGRTPEAIRQFRERLTAAPADAEARAYLAVALVTEGDREAAAREVEAAIRLQPRGTGALRNLGIALAALGRPAEAVPYFRSVLGSDPDDAPSRYALARAYMALGRPEAARAHAEALLRLDPRLYQALGRSGS
jgi:tetratricopeptide (TPR) repeat protein